MSFDDVGDGGDMRSSEDTLVAVLSLLALVFVFVEELAPDELTSSSITSSSDASSSSIIRNEKMPVMRTN